MFDLKLCGVYAANSIPVLQAFEQMVGRKFDTALVFNNAAPSWSGWAAPWFLSKTVASEGWGLWATAPDTSRRLIVTQNPFPSSYGPTWLDDGAAGKFAPYATTLAQNLVKAGVGNSIIRLAHEANGTGNAYSISPTWTPSQFQQWIAMWRSIAQAMTAVSGSAFLFDWCINAYWQPVALADWYPGDDVVDIIGIDAYDAGIPLAVNTSPDARWQRIWAQTNGLQQALAFAAQHGKPLSIPEWGLQPAPVSATDTTNTGGGDDPAYVTNLAQIIRDNPVAYQSYFYNGSSAALLAPGSQSLAAYRAAFVA